MTTKSRLRFVLVLGVAASVLGCPHVTCPVGGRCLTDDEQVVIEEWLLCEEECAEQLDRVLDLGWRAVRRLAGALERPPLQRTDRYQRQLRDSHRRSGSILPQADYVDFHLQNYTAQYQKRAAIALGDLAAAGGIGSGRARDELQNALDEYESGSRAYRADVVAEIERGLQKAVGTALWATVNADSAFSCGLTRSGDAYCWGLNNAGQLGDGTAAPDSSPVAALRHITFSAISSGIGHHTCGAALNGHVFCWGRNNFGQIGDGTTSEQRRQPTAVALPLALSSVGVGDGHTCADSMHTGTLFCWGRNDYGQLGLGTLVPGDTAVPARVATAVGLDSLTLGSVHTCALAVTGGLTSGPAYCWGLNSSGQLGDGTNTQRLAPAAVSGPAYAVIYAGGNHTCAATPAGEVECWGLNSRGQLGDGTQVSRNAPTAVSSPELFVSVTAGLFHTCALTAANDAYCWGDNTSGQLGTGYMFPSDTALPARVTGGQQFLYLDAGATHTCGVTTEGEAYCWGNGLAGQLGIGIRTITPTPIRVTDPLSP